MCPPWAAWYTGGMSEKPKKRGRPKEPAGKRQTGSDRHRGVRLVVYIPDGLAARLDAAVESIEPRTTKTGVVRTALTRFLGGLGEPGTPVAPP